MWARTLPAPFLCSSFVRAVSVVPSSRPALVTEHRAQGPSGLAVARQVMLAAAFPGHALTASSTVRGSRRSGRCRTYLAFEFTLLCENGPGDAGKFIGKCDRQHIMMQPLFGGFDPGFKAVAFPVLCPDQQ